MIMEIAESIFKFILASLNVCALAFTLILVSKWHIRMENKLDEIEKIYEDISENIFKEEIPEEEKKYIYVNLLIVKENQI